MTNKPIEVGSNPFRLLGATYSARMFALSKYDKRPLLTIHLVFLVLWLRLPWAHVSPKSLGATSDCWGFCLGINPVYFRLSWGTP